jgi:tetratricopeptide (TPR) repeat protein
MNAAKRLRLITLMFVALVWNGSAPLALAETGTLFTMALQQYAAGQQDRAVTTLKETLSADPDFAPAHELMGLILAADSAGPQAALSHLLRATELWPDHSVYWVNLAIFYVRGSSIAEAEKALQHSLNSAPCPQAYELLAIVRLDQQRTQEAIKLLRQATALAPEELSGWYYLGLAYQAASELDLALTSYQEALRHNTSDFDTHRQLGIIYLDLGRSREALDHLREADALHPHDAELAEYLSRAYFLAGNLERAAESARQAVQFAPSDSRAHYQLGLIMARLDMKNESAREFRLSETLPRRTELSPLERWRQTSTSETAGGKGGDAIR